MDGSNRYEEFLAVSAKKTPQFDVSEPHIAVGYTSDLDVLLNWDQAVFDKLIAEHLHTVPSFEEGERIETLEDFARIMAHFVQHGMGGEIEISSPKICDWLVKNFQSVKALGGTGAQCSAALGTIGYPVAAHISDKCAEVCEFLDYPSVKTVKGRGLCPVMVVATEHMPVYHFICQYDKGARVTVGGKTFEAPVSNRLILDFDIIHKRFLPDRAYFAYLEKHATEFRVLSISGFNAIVSPDVAKSDLAPLVAHFKALKQKNPSLVIYLESAHYLSCSVRDTVFELLGPYVDILGMNEEEVQACAELQGVPIDKNNFDSMIHGLSLVLRQYPVGGIILHTKDYAAYFGKPLKVDIELGLTAGNLLSGTRARTGHYGNLQECRELLQYGFSQTGAQFSAEAAAWQPQHPERQLVLVPSRYLERPRCTIGLGDTIVAGVLTCFA